MNDTATTVLDRSATQEELNRALPDSREEPLLPKEGWSPKSSRPVDCACARDRRIKRILVPTDFSQASGKALERAVAIANQCDANLTILHVIDINAQVGTDRCASAEDLMKHLWGDGSTRMGQLAWSLCGQVKAQTAVQEGLPWEEIVERSRDFDLVLLGESRAKRRWNFFSKRTAQRVLENAACPVMLVREEE
jgi:nucleotide-binding universal stress UspA family protein